MNLLLLVLALAQAPAAEKPVDELIAAFVIGDDKSRAELVRLGAFAIRPLQKSREKSPDKIDALVYELKKAAALPVPDRFDADFKGTRKGVGPLDVQFIRTIGTDAIPLFLDPDSICKATSTRFEVSASSSRKLVEQICRQTGLDYGYFHNHIVIGTSERLWPPGPPPPQRALTADEKARAQALTEKLCDESLEAREVATRELLALGPAILPIVKAARKNPDAEVRSRCESLIVRLEDRPRGTFGPAGALRQRRTDTEEKSLKHLEVMKADVDFRDQSLTDCLAYLREFTGLQVEAKGDPGRQPLNVRIQCQRMLDCFSLIAQSRGMDFYLRDLKVIVDTREAVEAVMCPPEGR